MSFLSKLFGGKDQSTPDPIPLDSKFAAKGGIIVKNGAADRIRDAISEYAALFPPQRPVQILVTVFYHPSGFTMVDFPNGVTPYGLVNLIGWLHAPPGSKDVSDALGWIESPETGIHYSLMPESESPAGDTLVGFSSDGKNVRVYQPEARMSEISGTVEIPTFPESSQNGSLDPLEFHIMLDADENFGNPTFVITDPKDKKWGDHTAFLL